MEINTFFNGMANEGDAIRKFAAEAGADSEIIKRIEDLKTALITRQKIEWQRNSLIKRMAEILGLHNDVEFEDFINS